MTDTTDVFIRTEGTLVLFTPNSPTAREWFENNVITDETPMWAGAVVVEHRFALSICQALWDEGLRIVVD